MNITSDFQIITAKANYFVSPATTARKGGLRLPLKAYTSALMTREIVAVAI